MKNIFKYSIILLFITAINQIYGQGINVANQDSIGYVDTNDVPPPSSPAVIGEPKSKAFSISYGLVPGMPIKSESELNQFNGDEETVERLEEIKVSLKVPLVLKKRTKLILGLRYQYEEFNFVDKEELTNPLFINLQNKHLNSISSSFYLKQSIGKRQFAVLRFGTQLNGDYDTREINTIDAIKFTFGAMYGIKKDTRNTYGLGIFLNYSFGRPVVYPTIMWNKSLTNRLGFDAVIPAKFTLRYAASEKDILKTGVYLDGGSYNIAIDSPPLNRIPTLELRRSSVRFKVEYEREIYDFLWADFKAGYRHNLRFNVSEDNNFNNDEFIRNQVSGNIFFEIGIFIVPPKRLATKYLKNDIN